MSAPRKIVQFIIDTNGTMCAVADDGSAWFRTRLWDDHGWCQVPPLPDRDDEKEPTP